MGFVQRVTHQVQGGQGVQAQPAFHDHEAHLCATVDHASRTLILMRVIITMPASNAVITPTPTNRPRAGEASINADWRISTQPPRFTTPACNSAETGVGGFHHPDDPAMHWQQSRAHHHSQHHSTGAGLRSIETLDGPVCWITCCAG